MTQNPTALEIAQAKEIKKIQSQIVIAIAHLAPEHDGTDKDCRICKAVKGLEEVYMKSKFRHFMDT